MYQVPGSGVDSVKCDAAGLGKAWMVGLAKKAEPKAEVESCDGCNSHPQTSGPSRGSEGVKSRPSNPGKDGP